MNRKPRIILIVLYVISLLSSLSLLVYSLLLLWSIYINPPNVSDACNPKVDQQTVGLEALGTVVTSGLCVGLGELAVDIVKGMSLFFNTFASITLILQLVLFMLLILRNDLIAKYIFLRVLIWIGLFLPYIVVFLMFLPDLIELLPPPFNLGGIDI